MNRERKVIDIQQIKAQEQICARIFEQVTDGGRRPLAMVDTYGCQQNEADSEKIRGYLAEMGYGFTQDEFQADVIVVNTCAVREHAEMRVLGNVGALNHTKKNKPEQIIAVCGCMVQQQHMAEKIKKSYPVVDLVFGPHELWRFPELFAVRLILLAAIGVHHGQGAPSPVGDQLEYPGADLLLGLDLLNINNASLFVHNLFP